MNHHHANVGDVMKHLALMCAVENMRPERYLESHAGGFDYPLAEREGPLPDGVWDFMSAASTVRTLRESRYATLLETIAGTPSTPGTYPGSTRCVWEILGPGTTYLLNDTDTEALISVGYALESRGVRAVLSWEDGIDMVLDEARAGDLVLIDPFDPESPSPKHGLSAATAFYRLVERGASVLFWRAFNGPDHAPGALASDLCVGLQFSERTGSMDGCEIILGNIPPDVAAEVGRLAVAHGAVLTSGRIHIAAASRPAQHQHVEGAVSEAAAAPVSQGPSRTTFDR